MIRTNKKWLVETAVQGSIAHPRCWEWSVGHAGRVRMVPGIGGITYNVKIGDPVYDWVGDHIEPCVSCSASQEKPGKDPNTAFNAYSCVGNDAVLISGRAKGRRGVVTGHHGGVEHVMIDFPDRVLSLLTCDDKVLIRAVGQGLELTDLPEVKIFSLDPRLLTKMGLRVTRGAVRIPVAAMVPAFLMGSGLGQRSSFKGDYDIQTSDDTVLKEHKLDKLRLGDIVAITDHKASHGYAYSRGAVTIGVVIHGDSAIAGHGPGVQVLMTTSKPVIKTELYPAANIGRYLKAGRHRKKT